MNTLETVIIVESILLASAVDTTISRISPSLMTAPCVTVGILLPRTRLLPIHEIVLGIHSSHL